MPRRLLILEERVSSGSNLISTLGNFSSMSHCLLIKLYFRVRQTTMLLTFLLPVPKLMSLWSLAELPCTGWLFWLVLTWEETCSETNQECRNQNMAELQTTGEAREAEFWPAQGGGGGGGGGERFKKWNFESSGVLAKGSWEKAMVRAIKNTRLSDSRD